MKKLSLLLLLVLGSCSGYFSLSEDTGDNSADNLALASGQGSLSLEDFNDVSPYVYTAPGGRKFLFFASDRPAPGQTNQSYNIWVSLMIGDKFSAPRILSNINTPWDETRPVVFDKDGLLCITYQGDSSRAIHTWAMLYTNDNFVPTAFLSTIPGSQDYNILLLARGGQPVLMTTWGSNLAAEFLFYDTYWKPVRARHFPLSLGQGDGFKARPWMGAGDTEWYVFERFSGGHWQITMGYQGSGDLPGNAPSGFFPIGAYDSPAGINDRFPHIDSDDGRVYFASDRYQKPENTHYDLYRYNLKTIDRQLAAGGFEYYPLPPGVYVSPLGSLSATGLTPAAPVSTLPAAVTIARDQGLSNIYVAQGIYAPGSGLDDTPGEPGLKLSGSPLRLLGGYDSQFIRRSGYSTLDGAGQRLVLFLSNINSVYLDGFRIIRGYKSAGYGGGIYILESHDSILRNLKITANTNASWGGAGIYTENSTNLLLDCLVYQNACTNNSSEGGGLYLGWNTTYLTLFGHIINNTANRAAGFYINDIMGVVLSAVITNNIAGYGGGIIFSGSPPDTGDSLLTNNLPSDIESGT